MANKFQLTVNSQQQDGFKLNFQAEDPKALEMFKDLSYKLIEKITKIEVSINEDSY